jgi:hypothetical protein
MVSLLLYFVLEIRTESYHVAFMTSNQVFKQEVLTSLSRTRRETRRTFGSSSRRKDSPVSGEMDPFFQF